MRIVFLLSVFLIKDLLSIGIDAYGIDISEYALKNCELEVIGRLHYGTADKLPFPDKSFSATISINVIHNLPRNKCITALREMERLAPGKGYVQVDSYRTPEEKIFFLRFYFSAISQNLKKNTGLGIPPTCESKSEARMTNVKNPVIITNFFLSEL